MNQYAIYLRKSRADIEAEAHGEGETLARHRDALRALAQRRGLFVSHEYAELVTGDSIAARPQMQALLEDVKRGMYAGVIVNDVDRLGRGDSIDQEIIKYSFVAGHCIIITPGRDIDPSSPTDEDMLDFSMFMARFEYRKIAQRMAIGRTRSAQAGNFIAAVPPYGYKRSPDNRLKLVPDEKDAEVVRMIYDLYASGNASLNSITRLLNEIGIKRPKGGKWEPTSVKYILRNPTYTGCNVWGRVSTVSVIENGVRQKKQIKGTPIVVEGTHTALVSKEQFDKIQNMFKQQERMPSVNSGKALLNPLSGLLYCSQCGQLMVNHGKRGNDLLLSCMNKDCPTVSAYLSVIMGNLLDILNGWCAAFKPAKPPKPPASKHYTALKQKEEQLQAQLQKAQELVEIGVYTPSEYLDRKKTIEEQLAAVKRSMATSTLQIAPEKAVRIVIPEIKHVLEVIDETTSPREQNELLKSVIARIDYTKSKRSCNKAESARLVKLVVHPKISGRV